MKSSPDRGVLTDTVLAILTNASWLVGDIVAPEGDVAGWQTQPSGEGSIFIPYVVLTPGTATVAGGPMDDSSGDWRLAYTLTSYGVDRRQVEDYADGVRRTLGNIRRVDVVMSDGTWRWQQTTWSSIGGVGYTQIVNPTAFSQTDSALIWLSKN